MPGSPSCAWQVQPDLLSQPDALVSAIARLQRHGLAVVVALFATDWHLETNPADQAKLLDTWRSFAPLLRRFDPAATFPEVLNEPVFTSDPGAWATLQHQAVLTIRTILPKNTIVLTAADWGSIDGLLSLPPESDPNVIYSFHLYEPAELTALGAYRAGLDAAAMARLPFPVTRRGCVQSHCRFDRGSADRRSHALLLCSALGCDEAECADRTGRRMGAGAPRRRAGRRIWRLAKPERAGARGMARHRAHGM